MNTAEIILSIIHLRTTKEAVFNFFVTVFCAIFGYFHITIIQNKHLFIAVLIVVVGDWIFGTIVAIKNKTWETQKALKIVYYFFTYSVIVFVVLSIENASPTAFFLSDAIVMPILIFQTISMLKNASLIGWIPKGLLLEILEKIDNYKTKDITNAEVVEPEILDDENN